MAMHRFALIILFGFLPSLNAALAADNLEAVDAWERRTVAAASAGAQEVAESAGEKEKAKPIDEQLWDAVAAQDRELAIKLLGQGADGGAWVDRGGLHIENLAFHFTKKGEKFTEETSSVGYSYQTNTALKKAVKDGSSEMVRLLLAAGAEDADAAAFQHAVRKGYIGVVKDFLVVRSDDWSDWVDVVKDFLFARSDDRMIDWEGPVVCGESCRDQYRGELGEKLRGHLLKSANAEAFSLFRQVGLVIDPDDLSSDQASALLVAAINQDDAEVALMALAGGADPNPTDDSGGAMGSWPILVAAVSKEMSPQIITALLDAGADVNAKVTGSFSKVPGFTALHFAAGMGNDDIVAVLLEREAAIDPVSDGDMWGSNKVTPLMLAANKGHAAVVRTLIGGGADVTLNVSGVTALKVAEKDDIKRMLRDARKRRD